MIYVPNSEGPTTHFKKQQVLVTQIAKLQVGKLDDVYVNNESMITFAKEEFLTNCHSRINITNINTKWDNANMLE